MNVKKSQRYKNFYHRALLDDAMPFGKYLTLSTAICRNRCNASLTEEGKI